MRWWRRLINRRRLETELDAELRDHIERQVADYVQAGLTEAEARRRAHVAFGGVDQTKESCRDVRRTRWLEEVGQDLRYAFRVLRNSPGFTIAAVLSLALGIGANTTIFALLDQVLLRPLPVERPYELALVRIEGMFNGTTWGDDNELSYPMYVDFRDHDEAFSGMFARFGRSMHVSHGMTTERVNGELVSGTYFGVLGVRSARGRLLTPDDDRLPSGHPVAVLSYRYWTSRFTKDEAVVGQQIRINGHPYTVVGVAEEGFAGLNVGGATQIFVPMMMQAQILPGWRLLEDRRTRFVNVFARLRPGMSLERAQASLEPLFRNLREQELTNRIFAGASDYIKQEFRRASIQLVPGFQGTARLRRTLTRPLWVLAAVAAGLLLVACANVGGLLLARGTARQREIAIRLALGASRARIIRQLLVENFIIALVGAASGILLATWGATLLIALLVDPEASANITASPDGRIVAFNFAVAFATGLIFGLMPAWQMTRPALSPTLKDQSTHVAGGRQVFLRKGLVVAQVATSLFLLVGAGLFVRSLRNLLAHDPGFATANLVTFSVDASLNGYAGQDAQQFYQRLIEHVLRLPGVTAAALTSQPLLQGNSWSSTMTVQGYPARQDEEVVAHINAVTPGYFAAMRIPILVGRDFTPRDTRSQPPAKGEFRFRIAIANQRFAELYLGTNPIGRHVGLGGNPNAPTPIEIVGVVGNANYRGIRQEVESQLFFPFLENTEPGAATAYVRTTQTPETTFAPLRRAVQEIDPNVPLFRLRSIDDQVARSLANERLMAGLSTAFGLLATLLAVVGLSGIVAYGVARRRREIGIRMALGAVSRQVTWLFLREALGLVALGCALALPVVWLSEHYVRSQLYGVEPLDPTTVLVAVLGLGAVAAAGSLVPTLRGARIQPLQVLREE